MREPFFLERPPPVDSSSLFVSLLFDDLCLPERVREWWPLDCGSLLEEEKEGVEVDGYSSTSVGGSLGTAGGVDDFGSTRLATSSAGESIS